MSYRKFKHWRMKAKEILLPNYALNWSKRCLSSSNWFPKLQHWKFWKRTKNDAILLYYNVLVHPKVKTVKSNTTSVNRAFVENFQIENGCDILNPVFSFSFIFQTPRLETIEFSIFKKLLLNSLKYVSAIEHWFWVLNSFLFSLFC